MLQLLVICSLQTYNPATFPVLSPISTYLFAQLGRLRLLFQLFWEDTNCSCQHNTDNVPHLEKNQ